MAGAMVAAPWAVRAAAGTAVIFFDPALPSRAAYERAIGDGADFLVAPVVMSQDGGLIVAPDVELSAFTDIAQRPEFAARRAEKALDGSPAGGWFSEDFTLAEMKSLATGRPDKRGEPAPTLLALQEVIDIARAGSVRTARVVGVSPRMIRPRHFSGGDLTMEPALAQLIALAGYDSPAAAMIVQAADPTALKAFGALCRARRIDLEPAQDPAAARGMAEALGPIEDLVVKDAAKGAMFATGLVAAAHAAGLAVYARFRAPAPHEPHGPHERLTALFLAGVDGVMGPDAALAARARRDAMDKTLPEGQS
ncbi:MAG TPA: glycerophosphodiester phosphodiesterase family protein [Caulobacteraceae bacterium]